MKNAPDSKLPKVAVPTKALTKVLGDSEQVKELVEECVAKLSSVGSELKNELAGGATLPGVVTALETSEIVETKAQEASDKLTIVNEGLSDEIGVRHELERQLASVTDEKDEALNIAFHDSLTGLPNRKLFDDRLGQALANTKRRGGNLAVMFIDLDDFKVINDSCGHDAGDSVLQTISARLSENTRRDDTVSRHGGDEFLYLLISAVNEKAVTQVAEKMLRLIQLPCEIRLGEGNVSRSVKASIGIAIYPRDGTTAANLIQSADEAMYKAKKAKSRYAFASLPTETGTY